MRQNFQMAGTLLNLIHIIYCFKLDLNLWIYPSACDTHTYLYPCAQVRYSVGMGICRTPGTQAAAGGISMLFYKRVACQSI